MKKGLFGLTPGEFLLEDYLKPMGISQYRLAKDLKVPLQKINDIVRGKRGLSVDTAIRLGRYFKTTSDFWLNMQKFCDLRNFATSARKKIEKEVPVCSLWKSQPNS